MNFMLEHGDNYFGNTCTMKNNQIKGVRWAGHVAQIWAGRKARDN